MSEELGSAFAVDKARGRLIIMAAIDAKGGVARAGQIPWHNPEDLRFFRAMTEGHVVLMGRRTFDTLAERSLPGRIVGVLTRQALREGVPLAAFRGFEPAAFSSNLAFSPYCVLRGPLQKAPSAWAEHSAYRTAVYYSAELERLLVWALSSGRDVFIAGGASVYLQCLDLADGLILSCLPEAYDCELTFPNFERSYDLCLYRQHASFEERQYLRQH